MDFPICGLDLAPYAEDGSPLRGEAASVNAAEGGTQLGEGEGAAGEETAGALYDLYAVSVSLNRTSRVERISPDHVCPDPCPLTASKAALATR